MNHSEVESQELPAGSNVADDTAHEDVGAFAKELLKRQGEKVRDARKRAGLTIEGLAGKTGLHFNTIGRIERGESEADVLQLLTIARALNAKPVDFSYYDAEAGGKIDNDEFALVDMLDVKVSAGGGALNGNHEAIGRFAFKRSWLKSRGVQPNMAKCIRARGDSMADKINDGDVLLLNTAVTSLEQDGVYVIELDGLDYVKLLQRDFATGGLQIISYNPSYKPQLLTAEQASELRISGRVLWHAGEF